MRRAPALAGWLATDAAEQQAVEAQVKRSSARATEVQNTLVEVLQEPGAKALLAQVLASRIAYTTARAKVFKRNGAADIDSARRIYAEQMADKRTAYLAALNRLSHAQRSVLAANAARISEGYIHGRNLLGLAAIAILIGSRSLAPSRSITASIRAAVKVAQSVSAGDLTSVIQVRSTDETGTLMAVLKTMNDSLVGIVAEVRSGTDTISAASSEIASGNLDLSARTGQQASALEQTASSMQALTSTVKLNAENARQANQLAIAASLVASQGGAVVAEVWPPWVRSTILRTRSSTSSA